MAELCIQAGLQDRVIQTYEGCMYMDFAQALLEERGYGEYVRLPIEHLPPLWLAYLSDQTLARMQKFASELPDLIENLRHGR